MLKITIRTMLLEARSDVGQPKRRILKGGLTIEITQERTGDVFLKLSRQSVYPSPVEIGVVKKNWPEMIPDGVLLTQRKEGTRYIAYGRWPRPAELVPQG